MLLIQYAFHAGYSGESSSTDSTQKNPLEVLNTSLESSFSALNADIPLDLSFAREAYVVQSTVVGNKYSGEKGIGILYVATSSKGTVAIVSSARPERTTIFSVDLALHVELIYDSLAKNKFAGDGKCDPLGQITAIQVEKAGVLKLEETSSHWSAKNKRQFLLNLTEDLAQLACQP